MAIDKSKTDRIKERYEELTGTLADPAVASDPAKYATYSKELAQLSPQVGAIEKYEACEKEIADLLELLGSSDVQSDSEMKEMATRDLADAKSNLEILEKELMLYLAPRDPRDGRSVVLEIRAGAG